MTQPNEPRNDRPPAHRPRDRSRGCPLIIASPTRLYHVEPDPTPSLAVPATFSSSVHGLAAELTLQLTTASFFLFCPASGKGCNLQKTAHCQRAEESCRSRRHRARPPHRCLSPRNDVNQSGRAMHCSRRLAAPQRNNRHASIWTVKGL